MPTKRRIPTDKEAFRTKLLDALRVSGYKQEDISRQAAERSSDYLWHYVTTPNLARLSKRYVERRKATLKIAVAGVKAAITFFAAPAFPAFFAAPPFPESQHVECLKRALADLLAEQDKKTSVLPSRPRGEDRDWAVVEWMMEKLEFSDEVTSALVNAADVAAGNLRETTPRDLRRRLNELKKRRRKHALRAQEWLKKLS